MFDLNAVDAVRPAPAAAAPRLSQPVRTGPFAGKVAIVTGSESGIGRETARALCEKGAAVVLNGRNAERLEHTRQAFVNAGFAVASCRADVTNYAD